MPTRPATRGSAAKKATRKAAKPAKRASTGRGATKRATKGTTAKRGAVRRTPATAAPRRATADNPSRGITRVDQPSRRTHGYVVRLDYRKTPGGYRPQITRFFPDGRHGSRRAAWTAAEEFLASASRKLRK